MSVSLSCSPFSPLMPPCPVLSCPVLGTDLSISPHSSPSPAPLPWAVLTGLRDARRGLLYSLLALLVLVTSQHRMWLTALAGGCDVIQGG